MLRFFYVLGALAVALGLGTLWVGCSGGGHSSSGGTLAPPPPPPPPPPPGTPPPPPPPPPPTTVSGVVPAGMPANFFFGLANNDLTTMPSGAGFKARYQYLTGGVNTNVGWETYNTPTGAFAGLFLSSSSGAGLLPVFTYQEMLPSAPAAGADEAAKIKSNLQNPTTMNAYFANWKLLLNQCSAFGGTVVVHLEPDLWGYVEQGVDSTTNSAASVPAAVASSGYPDVAGLPNTVQGYALALLKMRDLYAPNARLALSLSYWGTNANWSSGTTLDTTVLGARSSAFLKTCGITGNPGGIKPMDLVFVETHDRDSGFYTVARGQSGYYWNDTDMVRYHDYLAAVNAGTGLRIVMWQIPIGNTFFKTCNDTTGHYQSFEAQYLLEGYPTNTHVSFLANAGVMGVLFGSAVPQATNYNDARNDGVTNPTAAAGNAGNTSSYADDDGGYLRLRVTSYNQAGAFKLP